MVGSSFVCVSVCVCECVCECEYVCVRVCEGGLRLRLTTPL
jgi:hypothetical protein